MFCFSSLFFPRRLVGGVPSSTGRPAFEMCARILSPFLLAPFFCDAAFIKFALCKFALCGDAGGGERWWLVRFRFIFSARGESVYFRCGSH
jgi:hypothetical protein